MPKPVPERVPQAVVDSIVSRFHDDPLHAERVLQGLKFDTINGNYYFYFAGMYVGVEMDGYLHT